MAQRVQLDLKEVHQAEVETIRTWVPVESQVSVVLQLADVVDVMAGKQDQGQVVNLK